MPTDSQVEVRTEQRVIRKLRRQVEAKEQSLVKTKALLFNVEKNNLVLRGNIKAYELELVLMQQSSDKFADLHEDYVNQLNQNFMLQERNTELNKIIHGLRKK